MARIWIIEARHRTEREWYLYDSSPCNTRNMARMLVKTYRRGGMGADTRLIYRVSKYLRVAISC